MSGEQHVPPVLFAIFAAAILLAQGSQGTLKYFLDIFKYTKIQIDSNVALHMHLTLTLSSAHVKKNTINHLFSSVSCFLFSSNSPKIEQIK